MVQGTLSEPGRSELHRLGASCFRDALSSDELRLVEQLFDALEGCGPGRRITGNPILSELLASDRSIVSLVRGILGHTAKPVRAVLFNKHPGNNWALSWHQDRTIVVRDRIDVSGFGPWSVKAGLQHVDPPFELLERMITLRVHLDPCHSSNAPLLISPGTHRLGSIKVEDLARVVEQHGEMTCEAERGDAWMYSTPIVHASKAAQIPHQRRVLQLDFSRDELPGGLCWRGV